MPTPSRRLASGAALLAASIALGCTHAPPPQPPGQSEERRLAVPEGWLQGSSLGIGPGVPVVFMHGVGGDHHLFAPQIREFRAARRVLAYDQRGCGESSDAPRGNYDLATRVSDLGAVLDAIRLDAVVLVGHGEGGQVVARYARQQPSRVVGLVLLAPLSTDAEAARIASTPESEFRPALEQWQLGLLRGALEETRTAVLEATRMARDPASREMLRDVAGAELTTDVNAYPGPVLVLLAPGQTAPKGLRPDVETGTMSAGSHWFQLDTPDPLNARLREFFKPLDAAAAAKRRHPG
ncbi:MAG: alpha/beta fold hydrolase [Myxococcaceae bacterium]